MSTVSATGELHLSVHTNRCIVSHPLRSDFAVKFGLNSLPTVIVVSQSKKKFVNLVGMFNDKSIASFLDGVLSGKHGTSSFQDLPQVHQLASPVARFHIHGHLFAAHALLSSTSAHAVK